MEALVPVEALIPAEAHGGPFHPSWIIRTKEDWAAHISAHTKETVARQLLLPHPKDQALWNSVPTPACSSAG
jgi:hypothetical protein